MPAKNLKPVNNIIDNIKIVKLILLDPSRVSYEDFQTGLADYRQWQSIINRAKVKKECYTNSDMPNGELIITIVQNISPSAIIFIDILLLKLSSRISGLNYSLEYEHSELQSMFGTDAPKIINCLELTTLELYSHFTQMACNKFIQQIEIWENYFTNLNYEEMCAIDYTKIDKTYFMPSTRGNTWICFKFILDFVQKKIIQRDFKELSALNQIPGLLAQKEFFNKFFRFNPEAVQANVLDTINNMLQIAESTFQFERPMRARLNY